MGRHVDGLIKAIKNVTSKDVTGNTIGEILEKFNLQYEAVELTLNVVDSDGEAVSGATVAVKAGATVGSGDAVNASNGIYSVKYGSYNYSVSKTGYQTVTGVINIDYPDVKAGAVDVTVRLMTAAIVDFDIKDADGEAVSGATITLKTGAEVGDGNAVSAEQDGTYKCFVGTYNYSVAKDGYTTATGTITITAAQLETDVTVAVTLAAAGT